MNKKEKIMSVIIVLLTLSLIIVSCLYVNMKKDAEENLKSTLNAVNEIYELNQKITTLDEELNTTKYNIE